MPESNNRLEKTVDDGLKSLYRAGAIAPLAVITSYLTEASFIFFGGEPLPTSVEGWFSLFKNKPVLGLFYLNAPDILSIPLLGIMFLALFQALKKNHKTGMTIASYFAFLGIGVFTVMRSLMLPILSLSSMYASASTDSQKALILAAGQTVGSFGNPTPQTAGFFFIATAVVILSFVMLQSSTFGKLTALTGILVGFLTVADDLTLVLIPPVSGILMGIAGALWLIWWIMISAELFKLGRKIIHQ